MNTMESKVWDVLSRMNEDDKNIMETYLFKIHETIKDLEEELEYLEQAWANKRRKKRSWDDEI